MMDFWFSTHCPVCRAGVPSAPGVCRACHRTLMRAAIEPELACGRCGIPSVSDDCHYCGSRVVFFDRHRSLFHWSDGWREVLHRWKYEHHRPTGLLFRTVLKRFARTNRDWAPDRIAWIDSGRSGRDVRAFQPCADLARFLGSCFRASAASVLRKEGRRRQSARDASSRYFQIDGSLGVSARSVPRNVLLLEDVFTTGATANEAARLLKKNGARKVLVLSLLLRESQDEPDTIGHGSVEKYHDERRHCRAGD